MGGAFLLQFICSFWPIFGRDHGTTKTMTGRRPGGFSATVELRLFESLTLQGRQRITTTKKKPVGRYLKITHQVGEPRELEHAGIGMSQAGVHVPSVDAVAVAKRFLATDSPALLKKVEGMEETLHDGSGGDITTTTTAITTTTTTEWWRRYGIINGRHIVTHFEFNFYQTGRRWE